MTGVSIITPSAGTQGTEMTQRMVFPIFTQSEGRLLILAPPDARILLQGYHMLFLLNGDAPSEAKWIRFSDLSQPSANPTVSPLSSTEDMYRQWVRLEGFDYDPVPNK